MTIDRDASFQQLVLVGSVYCWVAPVLVAALGRSLLIAAVFGVAGVAGLALAATRLPGVGDVEGLLRDDRWLAVAVGLVTVSPLLMLGYAVTGEPWALGAMIVAGTAALIIRYVVRGDFSWTDERGE